MQRAENTFLRNENIQVKTVEVTSARGRQMDCTGQAIMVIQGLSAARNAGWQASAFEIFISPQKPAGETSSLSAATSSLNRRTFLCAGELLFFWS